MHDTIWIIAMAGLGTFLLRFIPLRSAHKADHARSSPQRWGAFFSAMGPAAIAALLAASLAPDLLSGVNHQAVAAVLGLIVVALGKRWIGGFGVATLLGALTYSVARSVLGI